MRITISELRRMIRESLSEINTQREVELLNMYVRDSRQMSFTDKKELAELVKSSSLSGLRLERIQGESLDWKEGDAVTIMLSSFTKVPVSLGKKAGHIAWKSYDKALVLIEHATRGLEINYDLIKVMFDASDEKEVLVSGTYRVAEIRKITEPGTPPQYGYIVPQYVLVEA